MENTSMPPIALQSASNTASDQPAPVTDIRSDLGLFCQALGRLTPPAEYRDKALSSSLTRQLASPDVQASIALGLAAIPRHEWADSDLQVDPATAMAAANRAEYLRSMATRIVNPGNAPWLKTAIHNATEVSGMRVLSLAISLRHEHSILSFESLIALAAVLLMPVLDSSTEANQPLPTAQSLNVDVPRLDIWGTVHDVGALLQQSGIELLCEPGTHGSALRFSAQETWHALSQTAQFKSAFAPLLDYMGWYGGQGDEQTSWFITQALAGRVIADHLAGAVQIAGQPLEKALRGGWVCDYSHTQLHDMLVKLTHTGFPDATSSTLDIMCYLFLREAMPELLVGGVPDHLQYGRSLQSVALLHGVALVEALSPGLSQITPYDELIKVSVDLGQSTDANVQALWTRTLIVPALRYAIAQGVVQQPVNDDIHQAGAEQVSQALAYLHAQQAAHARELNSLLGSSPPDRKRLAQHMLKEAGVDWRLWDKSIRIEHWPILQEHGFTVAASYSIDRLLAAGRPQASVIELVMMGEVYIEGQPAVPEAYASAFDLFQGAMVSAQAGIIERLLSEMQPRDRADLLNSTCELSRVRFESQEGTQGLFVRCQRGDHLNDFQGHSVVERFFQLIPAAGVAGEVHQAFTYEVEDVTWSGTVSIIEAFHLKDAHQRRIEEARVTPLLPMDSDAYLSGSVSRSTRAYHRPQQGMLVPSAELVYFTQADEPGNLQALANKAALHLLADFLEQSKVLHLHETEWEKTWAKEREYADLAARLVIPFYGCIKDLSAGGRSGGLIISCVMDAAFLLIPLGQFAGSTARIILRAGEMSVESVARVAATAVKTLITGLAKQSAIFALHDLGKAGLRIGARSWAALLDELPSLRDVFASQSALEAGMHLDKGMYRLAENAEQLLPDVAVSDLLVKVDGKSGVVVRNTGTPEQPDFRLSDPLSDAPFGKRLTPLSGHDLSEFSVFSAQERIGPDHYPAIAPLIEVEDGFYEVCIAEDSHVLASERDAGVFQIRVDDHLYRLDAYAPDAALRKLKAEKLSQRSEWLLEAENVCRVRRDLISLPCTDGVRLKTPTPEPVRDGSTSPKRTGKYPSNAMDAREFRLDRLKSGNESIDVFVNEGKICKWADAGEVVASTSTQAPAGKVVMPLADAERALFALPEAPVYLPELAGVLASEGLLGLPENFVVSDAQWIYEHMPVVEVGPIASGINDARTLRGIRFDTDGMPWIFIEPDSGVFYKAPVVVEGSTELKFSRVTVAEEISEYLRLSEQYRLVRDFPHAEQDQENIARLLFDLLDDAGREAWSVAWGKQITRYEEYAEWCTANQQKNRLMGYAANILSGELIQKRFVELTRDSIPDFQKVIQRSLPEQQHIVEVLNHLLPAQGSPVRWERLGLESIVKPKAARSIMNQVKGANLSFLQAHTEAGERIVYYALSGGRRAKSLKLKLDLVDETERVIDGVIYRDARARMAGRAPDPGFTSLPVIRDAGRLVVSKFERHLDSERLIATIFKEDMASTRLTHIKVFTVMDTCRSCGGFVLPRLKLDFPEAQFSVTYLKDYQGS
ncbi:Uncharacterized protein ALO43_04682 [Pseudomonas tremae]|uniref:Uncharacterized protein n=2 Tax=Pseudomonas TaxID=286 RepID=A0AA40P397_9PSED|nr:Uncharacterized protein ALO43_04682 [Pseudomonas tremae]RMO05407.1 hypothetical protein ALQ48_05560 [Pseudomonas coronafaciens pv. zizaniae]